LDQVPVPERFGEKNNSRKGAKGAKEEKERRSIERQSHARRWPRRIRCGDGWPGVCWCRRTCGEPQRCGRRTKNLVFLGALGAFARVSSYRDDITQRRPPRAFAGRVRSLAAFGPQAADRRVHRGADSTVARAALHAAGIACPLYGVHHRIETRVHQVAQVPSPLFSGLHDRLQCQSTERRFAVGSSCLSVGTSAEKCCRLATARKCTPKLRTSARSADRASGRRAI